FHDRCDRAMLPVMHSYCSREVFPMTIKIVGGALAAAVVALAAVLTMVPPVDAQGPIRIGASLSLTGTYAKLGKNQHEGYQLCLKDLNAKGGLLGRKLELVAYDDQSMPPT